jgi:hypothetical protein
MRRNTHYSGIYTHFFTWVLIEIATTLKPYCMHLSNQHRISLQEAIHMTALYRENRPANFPICETFPVEAIAWLTGNPACAFFRIYYGMKDDMLVHAILVAADSNGNDLLPLENRSLENDDENGILEDSIRCPNTCPPDSPLNQS